MKSNVIKKIKLNHKNKEEKVETNINSRKFSKIFKYNEIVFNNAIQFIINNSRIIYTHRKKNNNYIFSIFRYIIINILISSVLIRNLKVKIYFQNNFITLKINKTGENCIFSCDDINTPCFPDEIYINEVIQDEVKKTYNLKEKENIIKLVWTSTIMNSAAYLFYKSSNITELNFSNFDTSKITNMEDMFDGCSSIISLDLSNFDTSNVKYMGAMVSRCSSLKSLDLSQFNTSKVEDMGGMFADCSSIISLNLSNFNTLNLKKIISMFTRCYSLKFLDISSFDTSKITSMACVFYYCSSLTSLKINNFDTSKVTSLNSMFHNCYSLSSLDLSSFDTSNVTYMGDMFHDCQSLRSLNLSNFDTSKVTYMRDMFHGCSSLEYLNLEKAKINDSLTYSKIFEGISENITILYNDNKWNDIINIYKKFIVCNTNENNFYTKIFYKENLDGISEQNMCFQCDKDYYHLNNDSLNNNSFINCHQTPNGFYFNYINTNPILKSCYFSCKKCDKEGTEAYHNCLECSSDYQKFESYDKY